MKKRIGAMLLVAAAACCFSGAASAQDFYGGNMGCCGGGWGGGAWVNRFYQSDRQIPYFAEHPPVYYSYPVPRTYGYSPYAYPGWVMTPNVQPAALEVINPHVPQDKAPKKKKTGLETDRNAANRVIEPLVVLNPYVASEPVAASSN